MFSLFQYKNVGDGGGGGDGGAGGGLLGLVKEEGCILEVVGSRRKGGKGKRAAVLCLRVRREVNDGADGALFHEKAKRLRLEKDIYMYTKAGAGQGRCWRNGDNTLWR